MVQKQGTKQVNALLSITEFLILPLLNMEKEEHLWNHLGDLASLKA
jgi:hypothetical protein